MKIVKNKLERIRIAVPAELIKIVERKLREANLHRLFHVLDNKQTPDNDVTLKYESKEGDRGDTVFILTGRRYIMTKEIAASHITEQATQIHNHIIQFLVDFNDKPPEEGPNWRMLVKSQNRPISD